MRAIRAALLLVTGLIFSLSVTTAYAAGGPGVIVDKPDGSSISLTGAEISAMSGDLQTYTLPGSAGQPSRDVALSTISIIELLLFHLGVVPNSEFVRIDSAYGGPFVVKNDSPVDLMMTLVSDDGHTTRYLRTPQIPSEPPIPVEDYIETADHSAPLKISMNGKDITVRASATPSRTTVGQTVTFQADISSAPPGAGFSYEWQFGDGQSVTGARVTHVYDTADSMMAVVSVRSLDPDCVTQCHGVARVSVQVGEPQQQPKHADPTPGGTRGAPQAPGSATGTEGSGQGDDASWTGPTDPTPGGASPTPQARGSETGVDGSGQGDNPSRSGQVRVVKPSRKPAASSNAKPRPPAASDAKPTSSLKKKHSFGTVISGVLINDPGAVVRTVASGAKTWAPKGLQPTRGGHTETQLQLGAGGLLALVMILLGARRERRSVNLHVA